MSYGKKFTETLLKLDKLPNYSALYLGDIVIPLYFPFCSTQGSGALIFTSPFSLSVFEAV